MSDYTLMTINVDDLSPMDAMANVKDIVVTDVLGQTKKITKEKLVLPVAQTVEMAEAIAIAQAAQAGAVEAMEDAGVSEANAAQSAIDAENAQSAIILGGIAHDAAAPTPATSGKYYFTTSGSCTWLTGGAASVSIGQEVLVVYTAPLTYTYTLLAVTANYVLSDDAQAVAPQIAFNKRVVSDGGTVRSKAFMQRVFEANKDLLADTELLYDFGAGSKIASGKIDKTYDLSANNNDGTTSTSKPYAGSSISPNEKLSAKYPEGFTGGGRINFNDIAFSSDGEWSYILDGRFDSPTTILIGAGYINISPSFVRIVNGTVAVLSCAGVTDWGENRSIEFRYKNGTGVIVIDGVPQATTVEAGAITFSYIEHYEGCCQLNELHILSKVLSAYESQNLHAFLSTEFPAIETIAVGSQQVATSNLEATVFGGTDVPEVTDNSAWAALSTPAWAHYNNDAANGAIYGKLYNGYAVDTIAANAPHGFHVPSELEWTMLSEYLGGNTVSGGKMKALYGGYNNAFSTNESGVSLLPCGTRFDDGSFGDVNNYFRAWTNTPSSSDRRYVNTAAGIITLGIGTLVNKFGVSLRLFSNTPHIETLLYDSGWVTTNIASGNLDIRTPFGTTIESIKVESETGITSLTANLLDYNKANAVALLGSGKSVTANAPMNFNVTADQPSGYTDNYVRINGTKADTGARFRVTIKVKPIQ